MATATLAHIVIIPSPIPSNIPSSIGKEHVRYAYPLLPHFTSQIISQTRLKVVEIELSSGKYMQWFLYKLSS